MILFSFFVFKLKVPSLPVFLDSLIFLPILNSLLQPFLHETCVSCNFVYLGPTLVLEQLLPCLFLKIISSLSELCLSLFLVIELLHVSLHDDGLLRLVEYLKPVLKESGCMLLVLLFVRRYLHSRAVIPNFTSYKSN